MSDRSVLLLGTPIDDVTLDEAVERIAVMVATGRRNGRSHQVATVNVDFVVNARQDPELRSIMQSTDLAIPDGMGIVWGARLIGVPIRQRTSGVDLVPALAEGAARLGWRLCLFGGAPGVTRRAASILVERHPAADIVALEAPIIDGSGRMDEHAAAALRAVDADVVSVALGNPKQERWIARHGVAVGAPVYIGIGGSLDFLTGVTRRAPLWMQRAGLEWIHRAISEPRRLAGRYAKDLVVFGPAVLDQAWRGRRRGQRSTVAVARLDRQTTIDLSALRTLDNRSAADLVGDVRAARARADSVSVVGVDPGIRESARRLGIDAMLDLGDGSA